MHRGPSAVRPEVVMGLAAEDTFDIVRLGPDNLASVAALFEAFPYKATQRKTQQLRVDRLARFYMKGLEKDLQDGRDRWLAMGAAGPLGLAGLNPDEWHTENYGLRMARIAPWLVLPGSPAGRPLLKAVGEAARGYEIEHLSVRLDGEDFPSLRLFETLDFHLVDVSLKFYLPFPAAGADWERAEQPRVGWNIRKMTSADAEWMLPLGGAGHGQNHFLNDPDLDPDATRELFSRWVARCIEGLAYAIYVIEDPSGQGRGFVTYLRNKGFASTVGRNPLILDYVILDPKIRGGGLGPWLVQESLYRERKNGFDFCELRTSQHNHRAVIGYEKLGFRLCATDFILHRKL